MTEAARTNAAPMTGQALTAERERPADRPRVHFDLANYREQVYGHTAICSYTLLICDMAFFKSRAGLNKMTFFGKFGESPPTKPRKVKMEFSTSPTAHRAVPSAIALISA